MPNRTEARRRKPCYVATGRLTPLRLFSTLPLPSPFRGLMSEVGMLQQLTHFLTQQLTPTASPPH